MTPPNSTPDELLNLSLLDLSRFIGANRTYVQFVDKANSNQNIRTAIDSLDRAKTSIDDSLNSTSQGDRNKKLMACAQFDFLQQAISSLLFTLHQPGHLPEAQLIDMYAPKIAHAANLISFALSN